MCDGLNNRIVKLNLDGEIQGVLSSYGRIPASWTSRTTSRRSPVRST